MHMECRIRYIYLIHMDWWCVLALMASELAYLHYTSLSKMIVLKFNYCMSKKRTKNRLLVVFINYNFCPHLESPVQCSAALIVDVFNLVNSLLKYSYR